MRGLIGLLGLIAVVTGTRSALIGMDQVVAFTDPAIVELDNNLRFASAIWAALGLGLWTCIRDPHARLSVLRVLVWLVFAGGVARIVGFVAHGLPSPPYLAILASELLAPLLILGVGPTATDRLGADR